MTIKQMKWHEIQEAISERLAPSDMEWYDNCGTEIQGEYITIAQDKSIDAAVEELKGVSE